MTNPLFAKNYTDKDYESMRKKIVGMIPQLTDDWTDFNESEPGMAYVEIASGIADMLFYYLDRQALENYLPTVEQRKNAKGILSIIGYKMHPYISNYCNVDIVLDEVIENDIIIPRYTKMIANKGTPQERFFNTKEQATIYAGQTSVSVTAIEGIYKRFIFNAGEGQGEVFSIYKYKLPDLAVAYQSVKIGLAGDDLTEVENIFLEDLYGPYFSVEEDKDGYTWIYFMPRLVSNDNYLSTDSIEIEYLISSGILGIARTGSITEFYETTIRDSEENVVTNQLSVINTENAAGGSDPETISQASYQAPRVVRTMWTAVTLEDFRTLVEGYPGVRIANVIDWSNFYGDFTRPNQVVICLVPKVGEVASEEMKDGLLELLEKRKLISLDLMIVDPEYVEFDIESDVFIKTRGLDLQEIKDQIILDLRDFYGVENTVFDSSIRISKIHSIIHNAHSAISHVTLATPLIDQSLTSYQLPKIDNIELNLHYLEVSDE